LYCVLTMRFFCLVLSACLLLVACAPEPPAINVAAASSLQDALREVAAKYEAETHERVALNFGGSNILARQIRAGAPADVFIAADEKQSVPAIEQRAVIGNELVVVGDLRNATRIAIGASGVPAGDYARDYIRRAHLDIDSKLVPMENVRAALTAVDNGSVDAAFVYRTDALLAKRAKITQHISGLRIVYPAALLHERGRGFYRFLFSDEASAIFGKYGFERLPKTGV